MLAIIGQEILSFEFLGQEITVPGCFDSGFRTFQPPIRAMNARIRRVSQTETAAAFQRPSCGMIDSSL